MSGSCKFRLSKKNGVPAPSLPASAETECKIVFDPDTFLLDGTTVVVPMYLASFRMHLDDTLHRNRSADPRSKGSTGTQRTSWIARRLRITRQHWRDGCHRSARNERRSRSDWTTGTARPKGSQWNSRIARHNWHNRS